MLYVVCLLTFFKRILHSRNNQVLNYFKTLWIFHEWLLYRDCTTNHFSSLFLYINYIRCEQFTCEKINDICVVLFEMLTDNRIKKILIVLMNNLNLMYLFPTFERQFRGYWYPLKPGAWMKHTHFTFSSGQKSPNIFYLRYKIIKENWY